MTYRTQSPEQRATAIAKRDQTRGMVMQQLVGLGAENVRLAHRNIEFEVGGHLFKLEQTISPGDDIHGYTFRPQGYVRHSRPSRYPVRKDGGIDANRLVNEAKESVAGRKMQGQYAAEAKAKQDAHQPMMDRLAELKQGINMTSVKGNFTRKVDLRNGGDGRVGLELSGYYDEQVVSAILLALRNAGGGE